MSPNTHAKDDVGRFTNPFAHPMRRKHVAVAAKLKVGGVWMERRRGSIVDGTSRFLSTLAILLGIGGGFFLYQENQTLKEQVGLLQTNTGQQEASTFYEDAREFKDEWNDRLITSLNKFKEQTDDVVRRENEERSKRTEELNTIVDQLRRDRVGLEQTAKSVSDLQTFVYAPKLQLARTSGRFGAVDPNFVMINNEGLAPADVVSVAFHPQPNGHFKTSVEELRAATARMSDKQAVVIEFSKANNRSAEKGGGLHSHYERAYQQGEKTFPGNRTVPLSVMIYNSEHVGNNGGWGWEGTMEIVYANGRSLFVPSVRAVFVPEATDTI